MGKKRTSVPSRFVVDEDEDEAMETDEQEASDEPASITDNALQVPLFAEVDGRSTRSISKLRLYRVEPGGPLAYKGEIPLSSTLDTIGQMFGDGIYSLEGLNHKGVVLATKDSIRISLGTKNPAPEPATIIGGGDSERIERLARLSAAETTSNNKAFLELIVTTTQAAAAREREFLQAGLQQMTQYFSGMMNMQQQGYQQMMGLLQAGHGMTLQTLQAADASGGGDKSSRTVEALLRGIKIGRDMGDDGEEGPEEDPNSWKSILGNGLSLLAQTKQQTEGSPALETQLTASQQHQLKEAVTLYRAVRSKGIDPRALLAKLGKSRPKSPEPELDEDSEEESDEDYDSDDSEDEQESDADSDVFSHRES